MPGGCGAATGVEFIVPDDAAFPWMLLRMGIRLTSEFGDVVFITGTFPFAAPVFSISFDILTPDVDLIPWLPGA
jgi:hypothetical protein